MKNNHFITLKTGKKFGMSLLTSWLLAVCLGCSPSHKHVDDIVFYPNQENKTYTFDVEIFEGGNDYVVAYEIYPEKFFYKKDISPNSKKRQTAKYKQYSDYFENNDYHVPLAFESTVENKQGKQLLQIVKSNPRTTSSGEARSVNLIGYRFQPGEYRIKIKLIEGDEYLTNFYSHLSFFRQGSK